MKKREGVQLVIGVDQGSSHTRAVVGSSQGQILGVGMAGGGYATRYMAASMRTIHEAVVSALEQADCLSKDVALLYAGLTSADWPDEYELLQQNLRQLGLAHRVCVTNDSLIALRGGTAVSFGSVIIAGTGANCALRAPNGETFIYHYYLEDDLQGGVALGRRALRAIYRAETGREQLTQLTGRVLRLFELDSVDALLRADCEQRLDADDIKHIAPLVFHSAADGDSVAVTILTDFAAGLAELVTAGLHRLQMSNLALDVVLSGSIFKGRGSLLEETLRKQIHKIAPHARLVNARYEPVVGAFILGLEELGHDINESIQKTIEKSCQEWQLIREKD